MKKIIAILVVVMAVVAMAACGPKGGSSQGGGGQDGGGQDVTEANTQEVTEASTQEATTEDSSKQYYGTWTCAKLESIDGSISDEIFESTRQQMLESKQLFYFEIGDKSYIYNPDGNGGFTSLQIVVKFDENRMYAYGNEADEILFTMKDGMIVIDETDSGVRFYMGKE